MSWYENTGKQNDLIISTRARLARNISKYPFPGSMSAKDAEEVISLVWDAITPLQSEFTLYRMDKISQSERQKLIEKHLISPNFTSDFPRAAIINKDETLSLMVNEEDHIRIQCLLPGYDAYSAYETADKIDTLLNEKIEYAFHEKYGYLTSCPTNTGTGMRISVMMHLPALSLSGGMNSLLTKAAKLGMTARGLFGEGSDALGNFYQLSNQITLGLSEHEIIENFSSLVQIAVNAENALRDNLRKETPSKLRDKLLRSYGIIKNAYLISTGEILNLISDVRFGIYLGIIKPIPFERLTKLMVMSMPANISSDKALSSEERDIKRAQTAQEIFKEV